MAGLSRNKEACLGLALTGAGLMSVAMFLHPMSPEDFLGQVASDPLQTVMALQGNELAALFWVGAMVGATGLVAGLSGALRRGNHLVSPHRLPAH
jgi:hypothetical protein